MKKLIIAVTILALELISSGCTVIGPIVPAAHPSGFKGATYSGETTDINAPTTIEQYRVFTQDASSFVPVQAVLEDSEGRGMRFCDQKGLRYRVLSETTSTPPHVMGNFPRAETVFECISK
jgi:hypothetical protein